MIWSFDFLLSMLHLLNAALQSAPPLWLWKRRPVCDEVRLWTVRAWLRLMAFNFVHLIRKILLPHSCLCQGEKLLGETAENETLIQLPRWRQHKVSVSADIFSFSLHSTQCTCMLAALASFRWFSWERNRFWWESPGKAQIWVLRTQP